MNGESKGAATKENAATKNDAATKMGETAVQFSFELHLFGLAEARLHEMPLPRLRARVGMNLLALLALRSRQPLERSYLAATLWPDSDEEQALYNLRRNLVDVRHAFGEQASRLESPTPRTLRLDLTDAFCDVQIFDAALRNPHDASKERLQEAVALYRGPLLEGCTEEWVFAEREARQQGYLAALEALASEATRGGDLTEAVRLLEKVVAANPYSEAAQRTLMETLAQRGDLTAATSAYREFRRLSLQELRSEPSAETQALFHKLRSRVRGRAGEVSIAQGSVSDRFHVSETKYANKEPGGRSAAPRPVASASEDAASPCPPCPLASLIGRIEERREVRTALRTARLVTLTGTGGVGKTRLALAVAEEAGDDFPEGIWFADLAPIRDGKAVAQAVAAALGLRPNTDVTPEETLRGFVGRKRLLLILDNGEQIADACARLAISLLSACPSLRILCTSRQPLCVPGENVWTVAPLRVPPAATDNAEAFPAEAFAADLTNYESAVLLLDRAARAFPAFRLTPRNAPAIAQLCRRLDGLPLALELIASRFRSLSAQEIVSRLDGRFCLPASGDSTPPRHQTLQAAFDWSYDLLNEAERRLLRRLTVFAGGWTLEAAEAVCASSEKKEGGRRKDEKGKPDSSPFPSSAFRLPPSDIFDLLASLIDKSLVVYEEREERGRYRLLETTRAYAAGRLTREERHSLQTRHAGFYWRMTRLAGVSGTEFSWQDRLKRLWLERDNFRAAHAWYQDEDAEIALWLEFSLYGTRTWPVQNARDWITRLQKQPMPPTALGACVSYNVGSWALWLGDPASESLLKRARDLACECGENLWRMHAIAALTALEEERGNKRQALEYAEATLICAKANGDIAYISEYSAKAALHLWNLGEGETARRRLRSLLEEGRQSGDWHFLYYSLWGLGEIALAQGEYAEANACCREILPLAERYLPFTLPNLWRSQGWAACMQQDYPAAWDCLNQALAISQRMHADDREGWTRFDMAEVAFRQGNSALAREQLSHSLSVFESLPEPRSVTQCLHKLAKFCVAWERAACAATLLAGAERAFRDQRLTISLEAQDAMKNLAADIHRLLDKETWQTAWRYGGGLTLTQATAYAFSILAPSSSDAATNSS